MTEVGLAFVCNANILQNWPDEKIHYKHFTLKKPTTMQEDIELLITTTRAMRKYQKQWYLYHNRKDLSKSISLESQVDEILKRLPAQESVQFSQRGLFHDDITDF